MYSYQDLLFSASLAVYVAVSVVVAAVRWGHKCEPYARHMDYYYPGWKVVVFCFLSNVLLLPAVFMPQEAACGYNRTYVSQVMSEHLGGFFVYVNRCRLAHAARLKVEQPQISVGDLIASSGFGSRQSYYNALHQLGK